MKTTKIITHPGIAHRDDFYGACVALAVSDNEPPIERTDIISQDDFEDEQVLIVDVGMRHEPDLNNFDHHQFPKNNPPVCGLSLLLQKLGVYESALRALPWLRPLEIWDTRGPMVFAKYMEEQQLQQVRPAANSVLQEINHHLPDAYSQEILSTRLETAFRDNAHTWEKVLIPTLSPLDTFVLHEFKLLGEIIPEYNLWQMMHAVGVSIMDKIQNFDIQLKRLMGEGRVIEIKGLKVLVSPEKVDYIKDLTVVVEAWRSAVAPDAAISISPDERSDGHGYSLYRFHDHPRVDFSILAGMDGIKFAHPNGFIAKTDHKDVNAAIEFVKLAIK